MANLPATSEPAEPGVSILDESNPLSVLNLLPKSIKAAVKRAAMEAPHLFSMDEESFLKTMRADSIVFTTTDHMLRSQFWIEYHKARTHRRTMMAGLIFEDACNSDLFYAHYLKNNIKVAWLCVEPTVYRKILENHLERLAHNMGRIIDLPLIDPQTGRLDKTVAQMQITLYKLMEVTLHGTPTQRIEQKTLSMNVTRHEGSLVHGQIESGNSEKMMDRLKELEGRERAAAHVPKLSEWQTMPVTNVKMTEGKD